MYFEKLYCVRWSQQQRHIPTDYNELYEGVGTTGLSDISDPSPPDMIPFRANRDETTAKYQFPILNLQSDQRMYATPGVSVDTRHSQPGSISCQLAPGPYSNGRFFHDDCDNDQGVPYSSRSIEHTAHLHPQPSPRTSESVAVNAWMDVSERQTLGQISFACQSFGEDQPSTSAYDAQRFMMPSPIREFQEATPLINHYGFPQNLVEDLELNRVHILEEGPQLSVDSVSSYGSPEVKNESETVDHARFEVDWDATVQDRLDHVPYAKLIYSALMEVPGHRMVLKDIYRWIEQNTDKANDPAFTGWQNSIRHNLSMNEVSLSADARSWHQRYTQSLQAFMKVPHLSSDEKAKRGYIWVLDQSAIGRGIQPTTRYRKKEDSKKGPRRAVSDTKKQRSGRKGGQAARRSVRLNGFEKHRESWPAPDSHDQRNIDTGRILNGPPMPLQEHMKPTSAQCDRRKQPLIALPLVTNTGVCTTADQNCNTTTAQIISNLETISIPMKRL